MNFVPKCFRLVRWKWSESVPGFQCEQLSVLVIQLLTGFDYQGEFLWSSLAVFFPSHF